MSSKSRLEAKVLQAHSIVSMTVIRALSFTQFTEWGYKLYHCCLYKRCWDTGLNTGIRYCHITIIMHKTEQGCFSGNPSVGLTTRWVGRDKGHLPMLPWRQVHTILHLQWVAKHVPACTAHVRPNPSLSFTRSGRMFQEIRGKQRHQENKRKKVTKQ